jgi:hypothetical protein
MLGLNYNFFFANLSKKDKRKRERKKGGKNWKVESIYFNPNFGPNMFVRVLKVPCVPGIVTQVASQLSQSAFVF